MKRCPYCQLPMSTSLCSNCENNKSYYETDLLSPFSTPNDISISETLSDISTNDSSFDSFGGGDFSGGGSSGEF